MTAIAIKEQTEELTALIVVCRSLSVFFAWPVIIPLRLATRRLTAAFILQVRGIDVHTLPEGILDDLHGRCRELCKSHDETLSSADWLSKILLKKPFSDLEDLCEDLALAADPEARELAAKIAAAIA